MARQLTGIIHDLRRKMETLAKQRDAARKECADLAQRVDSLSQQLEDCQKKLKKFRMEVDFLTVAQRIDSPDNLISARRRLQRLIAKIDRCVALLKDDADIS
ncbi:MAG: hypothetical protein NC095_02750 [Muribaculum sp.]|nr:hypothetical protein [Muribaculum sp.]